MSTLHVYRAYTNQTRLDAITYYTLGASAVVYPDPAPADEDVFNVTIYILDDHLEDVLYHLERDRQFLMYNKVLSYEADKMDSREYQA
jgi:hypothetical protein